MTDEEPKCPCCLVPLKGGSCWNMECDEPDRPIHPSDKWEGIIEFARGMHRGTPASGAGAKRRSQTSFRQTNCFRPPPACGRLRRLRSNGNGEIPQGGGRRPRPVPCQTRIKARDYLILHTGLHAVTLCDEQMGMDAVMNLTTQAAQYIVEGQECTKASRTWTSRLHDNIGNDFNKDGEAKFCAWVSQMFTTKNSDLWLRFAR